MSNAAKSRVISDAIFTLLETDLAATGAGVPLGDGIAPADVGTPPLYAVLDHMDGTVRDTLARDDRWLKHVVQVRSVGPTRSSAQYVQDAVRTSLLARDLTVSGATLVDVAHEVGGRVSVDNDADPTSLFIGFDRIAFHFDVRG